MVKNLIIKFGRLILDAIAAISFVVALLYSCRRKNKMSQKKNKMSYFCDKLSFFQP
ncbi:hypothetical protein QYK99_001767 [Campylobacter jejuni]|nr:hypothetical protein [Campylobacter jejuni]